MKKLIINTEKITDIPSFLKLCPFGALEYKDAAVSPTAACKMCKICVKKGPEGAAEIVEEDASVIDKSEWRGICVYVDHEAGNIHPVTLELIGKARELADKVGHEVYCLFMGENIRKEAEELLHYGVDKVFLPGGTQHLEEGNFGRFDDKLAAAGGAACYLHKAAGGKLFENFIGKLFGYLLFLANLGNAAQLATA